MTSEAGSLFLEPEKKLYGCTRANCKQTEILVKDLTTHDEARGVKLYAPYCVCLSLSADPVWMINSMLPSLAANSNNKYFQNIVTWSTTSRTLLAYFKLSPRFLCRQYLPVASIPTYLKKDKNKYAKSELSTAMHTISLRYFLVLYVTSVILLSIVKQIHGEEKWKTNVVTLVYGTFQFHIAWPTDRECTLHVYLRNPTNNLTLEFATIAVKKLYNKMTENNFTATRYRVTYVLNSIFRKTVD